MSDDAYQQFTGEPPSAPPPERGRRASSTLDRDIWRASASFGWLIGAALALVGSIVVVFLIYRAAGADGGQRIGLALAAVILLLLVVGIVILLRALPNLRYRMTNDALVIEWFGRQHLVPLDDITLVEFEPDIPLRLPRWEPFWPGYYVATVRTRDGVWRSWATQQPQRRVRLTTSTGIVAISPERPVRFVSELERRIQRIGWNATTPEPEPSQTDDDFDPTTMPEYADIVRPAREPMPSRRPPPRLQHGGIGLWFRNYRDQFRTQLLTDHLASVLLGAGVVLPFMMVAYLYSQFEGLPDQIPLRWNAANDVIEWSEPGGLWRFPAMAAVVLIANTALASILVTADRYLARLMLAGVPLVQLVVFIALIRAAS